MADRFVFHSKSARAAPGRGVGERVADPDTYAQLATVPDWRRVLSNFHVSDPPFTYRDPDGGPLDGHTFRSIEHVFHAKKFEAWPATALRFAFDSGDPIGQGTDADARSHRRAIVLDHAQRQAWEARRTARCKYGEDAAARRVLVLTGHAELWHCLGRSGGQERFVHLEALRSTFQGFLM